MELVLSLFTGAGLLDRGFKLEGFCVVSAGDIILGHDIREFKPAQGRFNGVIGGSPCQDFSKARRTPPTGEGIYLVMEFARVVHQARPEWFLFENVDGSPDLVIPGYTVQRFNLNAKECGSRQNRPRRLQFGSLHGFRLVIDREAPTGELERCCLATEGAKDNRRPWDKFCDLQGLSPAPEFPGLSTALKYRLVGNGVPVPMARVLARAIRDRGVTPAVNLCACECGRRVTGGGTMATASCRKRMQRRRDASSAGRDRSVTRVAWTVTTPP